MKKEAVNRVRMAMMMLIVCFVCISFGGFKANAASVSMGLDSFELAYFSDSSISVRINTGYSDVWGEVQVLDLSMNVLATKDAVSYASIPFAAGMNQVYYYRVRPFTKVSGVKVYVGDYSPLKAFSTLRFKDKASKKEKVLKLKCPAVPGVVSVTVMMSTSRSSGYKAIAKVRPGKATRKIKKFAGRAFKNYTYYYFYPQPTLANGVPCENVRLQSVYWSRRLVTR